MGDLAGASSLAVSAPMGRERAAEHILFPRAAPALRSRLRYVAWILGAWTVAGLFFGSQLYALWPVAAGRRISWARALGINLPFYYLWALLTPIVLALARRFPIESGRWRRSLAVHLPASVVLTGLQLFVANVLLFPSDFLGERGDLSFSVGGLTDFFRLNFHTNFLTYWGVVGLVWALDTYRKFHLRELQASELRTRLVQAELSALQMQLHPHFVFNTLNAISALIPRDPAAAERMLVDLSGFLRLTLQRSGEERVVLKQELEFLERYLRIEETRLMDRLTVIFDVVDDTLDAEVPNLILQPLVENAIRHGVMPNPGPGRIEVRARREGDGLVLQVVDNGRGLVAGAARDGIGLSNTRGRLAHLYGESGRLVLESVPGGGLAVTVAFPFTPRNSGAPAPYGSV